METSASTRRRRRRLLLVVIAPMLLFTLWIAWLRGSDSALPDDGDLVPVELSTVPNELNAFVAFVRIPRERETLSSEPEGELSWARWYVDRLLGRVTLDHQGNPLELPEESLLARRRGALGSTLHRQAALRHWRTHGR